MDLKVFATVFAVVFVAELGDKTQLATMLFAADSQVSRLTVFIGASAALVAAAGLGVLAGGLLGSWISERVLSWIAGIGFIAIGVFHDLARGVRMTDIRQPAYPPEMPDAQAHVYQVLDGEPLRLWVFTPQIVLPDGAPAIVFFFGGGWRMGTPEQFLPQCRHFRDRGLVTVAVDYRVQSRHGVNPDACVADAKAAFRWLRDNADSLGIDPDMMAAAGGSAGGHLAASLALLPDPHDPDGDPFAADEELETDCEPDALILFNPVLVLPFDDDDDGWLRQIGLDPADISPHRHLAPGLPPTIIFHGAADTTVPLATAERFTDIARSLGNPVELVRYPGAVHGFFNWIHGSGPGSAYADTLARSDRFLVELGWLPPD